MKTRRWLRPLVGVAAAACLTAMTAQADTTTYDTKPVDTGTAYTPPPPGPSVNNDAFRKLRATCEKDVPLGKASGDVCVEAAGLLVGSDLPDEFREMKEDQRIKIALRLLERGVDSSNLARAKAFDYYDKIGFLGMSTYADSYRAKELMEMMNASNYPGGALRKMRSQTTILSLGASEAEKRAACTEAKRMLAQVKLDADSTRIAREIVGSGICTGYEAPANK